MIMLCLVGASTPARASDWEDDTRDRENRKQQVSEPADVPSMPMPVTPKKKRTVLPGRIEHSNLDGKANRDGLSGRAEDEGDVELQPMTGRPDPTTGRLQGSAKINDSELSSMGDPDIDDQELKVEWDRWRNRFLYAVQSGVQEALNNPDDTMLRWDPNRNSVVMRFPLGTVAWFSCKISNNRHIEKVKLMKSSGFPNYDQAVIDAVNNLEGTTILRFPKRSRRVSVSQTAGIKTSDSAEQQYFKFGDVERYRMQGPQ